METYWIWRKLSFWKINNFWTHKFGSNMQVDRVFWAPNAGAQRLTVIKIKFCQSQPQTPTPLPLPITVTITSSPYTFTSTLAPIPTSLQQHPAQRGQQRRLPPPPPSPPQWGGGWRPPPAAAAAAAALLTNYTWPWGGAAMSQLAKTFQSQRRTAYVSIRPRVNLRGPGTRRHCQSAGNASWSEGKTEGQRDIDFTCQWDHITPVGDTWINEMKWNERDNFSF